MSSIAGIKPCSKEELQSSDAQFLSTSRLDSRYLSLHNVIDIERLSPLDFMLLRSLDPGNPSENKALISMVARTYPAVLSLGYPVFYSSNWPDGHPSGSNMTSSANTIVLWLEYVYQDKANDSSSTRWKQAHQTINMLMQRYSQEFSQNLDRDVKIVVKSVQTL
jgi:hypothetical protein